MKSNKCLQLFVVICVALWAGSVLGKIIDPISSDEMGRIVGDLEENLPSLFGGELDNIAQSGGVINENFLKLGDLQKSVGDPKALKFIAELIVEKDDRAKLALANYLQRYPKDMAAFHFAAVQLFGAGKYKEAELALKNITRSAYEYAPAHLLLGLSYLAQNRHSHGIDSMKVAVEKGVSDPLAYRYLAWDSLKSGDLQSAIQYLEMGIAKTGIPNETASSMLIELTELYRQTGGYEKVVWLLNPLIGGDELDLTQELNAEAVSRYFESVTRLGDKASARRVLGLIKGSRVYDSFLNRISRARLLAMEGDSGQAEELLEGMRSENPELERKRLRELAGVYVSAGRPEEALEIIEHLIESVEGVRINLLDDYVSVASVAGSGNKAIAYVQKLEKKYPDNLGLKYTLAKSLLSAGDLMSALSYSRAILKVSPNYAPAYYIQGVVYYNRLQNDLAAQAFRKAVDLEPSYIDAWLALAASVHDHRGHSHTEGGSSLGHAELMPILREAINKNPGSVRLLEELGITAYSGSQLEVASQAYADALAISPVYVPALNMSAIVRADLGENLDAAVHLAELAYKLSPDDPAVQDVYGWALIRSGEVEKGIGLCHKALMNMPDDPPIQFHLGMGYALKKDDEKALSYLMASLVGDLPGHLGEMARKQIGELRPAQKLDVKVHAINGFGVVENLGVVLLQDTPQGLRLIADLKGLPPGLNAVHFHQKPTCEGGVKEGVRVAGLAAGGHYGHDHVHMSGLDAAAGKGMSGMKPRGDMPPLAVDSRGISTAVLENNRLVLSELRGRSLMIHNGEDLEDGSSGPKIACGIIE